MVNTNLPSGEDDTVFVSPQTLAYLADTNLAHDLIDELRWDDAPVCPRCSSKYIKQVNTHVFRQLYRCIDCGYMFNSLAGTIFHGSKMPVNKYIHFFILHNAFDSVIPLRDLGYALDVSHKTASLLMSKVSHISYPFRFAQVDKGRARGRSGEEEDAMEGAPFFSYCHIKSVFVSDVLLRRFIQQLSKGAVPGIEHVHIDP